MGDTLIDLGDLSTERPPGRPVTDRRRPRPYRAVLVPLAVVLVLLLSGAAHRAPPAAPAIIPARLGDLMFVAENRLFLVGAGPELVASPVRNRIISTYDLPSGDLESRTTVAVSGPIFNVAAAGSTVLVSYQVDTVGDEETVALAAGTGRALWRQPSRMLAVSGRDGLVLLRTNTSELGKVTWSGIDLATGAVRWSLRQPVRGLITEADYVDDFPRYLVSATETGDLAVRDAVTGAVLATARVPVRHRAVGADVSVWPTDDMVLVGAPDGTNAYALPDLVQRWHSAADLAGRWVQSSCGTAICSLSWRGGLVAMDPLTGRRLWADRRWTYADQVGRYLLTTENAAADVPRTVSVVDPVTGAVRGTFGRWHTVGAARPDGTVVGLRSAGRDDPADTVWYAVLDPATLQTRLLGRAEDVSGDCQTAADVLVCRRIDASVGLWRLK